MGETTLRLLEQVQEGDRAAREALCRRFLNPLRGWARGRLPPWARPLLDTDDLVQETMLRTLRRVSKFEARHKGGFLAYQRQILGNLIRDEIRRLRSRPTPADTSRELVDAGPSPVEAVIGRQSLLCFEGAMAGLPLADQEAIIARVELGLSYRAIAEHLGKPSPDAARMATNRALLSLAREMHLGAG